MLTLDVYECIFSLNTNNKTYQVGSIIEPFEYNKLTEEQKKFFYETKDYVVREAIEKIKEDTEFVTESLFEVQFGFKDTLDITEYKESEGLEVRSIPKQTLIEY